MKYWSDECKVPVTSKKGQKGKKPIEASTSQKSNSLAANTRKVIEHANDTRGSATMRKTRQKDTQNPTMQEKDRVKLNNGGAQKKDINGSTQKETSVPT